MARFLSIPGPSVDTTLGLCPYPMRSLELKIPPVLVTVVFATLMWLVSLSFPGVPAPMALKLTMFTLLATLGAFFSISGVAAFIKARTTVNPITPDASSSLVTTGIYQRTRNPMYVGFLFFLLATGFLLFNFYSLTMSAGFVLYMNRFQIRPEESALESFFGEEYIAYRKRVRRWL